MEPDQNITTEVVKTQQNPHVSIGDSIAKMKLAFDNALWHEIFEPMQTVGYTEEKITGMKGSLTHLESLQQVQIKEYAEQFAETEKFDLKRTEIDELYTRQKALAKILFKGNVHAQTILLLLDAKPKAYSAWVQQITNFYAQLTAPELIAKATPVGITVVSVAAQKQGLADLQALKDSQRKETAEAQQATETRDAAFDQLYPLYSEYIKYAKIMLAGNQMLEAIGVKVKKK